MTDCANFATLKATQTEITISVPIYYIQKFKTKKDKTLLIGMNTYRNLHYRLSNTIKQHYKEEIQKILPDQTLQTPCKAKFAVYLRRNNTDGGNVRSCIEKFVLDAFIASKVIPDDKVKYLIGDSSEYFIDENNPRCEVTLYSV
ncbi:MAG: hypothetical protein WAW92_04555 [Minisyncoccia bacterium]